MISKDLFDTLETEFKELIDKIESEILELENSQNPDIIHSIFRSIHTIKGNSAMVGMDKLRDISHSLETLFSRIRSRETELKTEMIEIVLKSIDRMKEIILDLKNESRHEVNDLIQQLKKYLDKDNSEIPFHEDSELKEDFSVLIQNAKNNNKYLSSVEIDFEANKSLPLSYWIQKINSLDNIIIGKGIKEKEIPLLSPVLKTYKIPNAFVLQTDEITEVFLKKHDIPFIQIHPLYSPENKNLEIKSVSEKSHSNSYLKVPTKIIDDLINLAGEAVIARNQLFRSLNLEGDSEEEIKMNRVSQFINSIYNRLMNVRLQKLGSIFPRLQRVARDASLSVGKDVKLYLEGHEIELDEVVIEGITESLLHIIRNSIDHGIEPAEERIRLNKNPHGEIYFKASLQGGNILIEIKDDGRGLNYEKIKKKALEKKLISEVEAQSITEEKFTELIFLPGFSTNDKITEVSGRGVGMDVVLTNFKKFGGSLKIETELEKGTKILGVIPQTLSVMPAFIISVSGAKFALLQKFIVELHKYNSNDILNLENRKVYKKGSELIPIIDLGELLFPENKEFFNLDSIAIISSDGKIFAVAFDHLITIEEIVLKPVPEKIKNIDLYGGITVAGDGSAILLLEPEGILKFSKLHLEKNTFTSNTTTKKKTNKTNHLVIEVSNQFFIINASDILYVKQISKDMIEFIFGKEMIQFEDTLIPTFRFEKFFNMKTTENIDYLYCIVIENNKGNMGILAQSLFDIFDSIEIKTNTVVDNKFVEGICFIENKTALYVNPSKILEELQLEVT